MAIEKGLYQAPVGLEELAAGPEIEIEIEDPEGVKIGVDGEPILEIDKDEEDDDFNANLAEEMDKGTLAELVGDLLGNFQDDLDSRKDWIQTYVDGLELLGMKIEEREIGRAHV